MIQQLKISKLISLSIQLAGAACQIVKSYYVNKNAKQYMKGSDDFVNQADYKVQSMLIKGLKSYYPGLKIVGEEDKEYEGQIQTDFSALNQNILPEILNFERSVPCEELCVWIDPIDCTKGFINGQMQDVTILMGVSQKKYAEIGIVGIPYKMVNGTSLYNPSVIFGSVQEKIAYQYFPQTGKYQKIPHNVKTNQPPVLITSKNRSSPLEKQIIKELKAENFRCGGSGRKIAIVLNQGLDISAYPLSHTHKWDTCAGHAIMRAVNGYFTDCFGDQILYNGDNPKEINDKGFICTLNKQLYQKTLKICRQTKKSNL